MFSFPIQCVGRIVRDTGNDYLKAGIVTAMAPR